jgi:hypothetical protein
MRITAPPGPANGRRHNLQRGAVGRLRQKRRRGRTPWSEPSSFRRHSDSDIRPMSQVPHHRSWRGGSLRPSGRALALQHRPRRQHRRLSRARARSCSSSRGRRRCRGGTGDGLNERRRADGYREALELLRTKAEFRPGLGSSARPTCCCCSSAWMTTTPSWMAVAGRTTRQDHGFAPPGTDAGSPDDLSVPSESYGPLGVVRTT